MPIDRSEITYAKFKFVLKVLYTCVLFETGRRYAPAPTTRALALAMDGRREPKADAER